MAHGLSRSTACGIRDLPRPGLDPVSPALAGGFLTTAPPGKSTMWDFKHGGVMPFDFSHYLVYLFTCLPCLGGGEMERHWPS